MSQHDEWVKHPTGKIGKSEWCECCGRYNSRNVVLHALVMRKKQVLMVRRGLNPMKGYWALVGGYLDWDETVEQCVLRELEEEVSVRGKIVSLLGIYDDPKRDKDGRQNVGITYVVEVEGEPRVGEEVTAVKWFAFDKLPEEIAFDHRRMIEDYMRSTLLRPATAGLRTGEARSTKSTRGTPKSAKRHGASKRYK